jgi:hypothetical protein
MQAGCSRDVLSGVEARKSRRASGADAVGGLSRGAGWGPLKCSAYFRLAVRHRPAFANVELG